MSSEQKYDQRNQKRFEMLWCVQLSTEDYGRYGSVISRWNSPDTAQQSVVDGAFAAC